MIWYGITGSWRIANKQVEQDVRSVVNEIIKNGNGIVTGGALNVDYYATDEALRINPSGKQIKIFIPTILERYATHYRKRAAEGVIIPEQAENLIAQLSRVKQTNKNSLIEINDSKPVEQATYYERDSAVVNASDELYAFQVNQSAGTQDTIDKAKKKGIPVHLHTYTIK